MADLSLFPEINPNIEEIIEREDALDGQDVIVEPTQEVGHNEIFSDKTQVRQTQNVKIKVESKKDKYSHLVEARKKGAITRQKKAEVKRLAKAEAKAIKDEEKRVRRLATTERNRVKARDRYRREKAKKEEQADIKEKIQTKKKKEQESQDAYYPRPQHKPTPQNTGMDFEKFAGYMMKYEGMKRDYENSRRPRASTPVNIPPPKEFPDNYPLSHIYSKNKNRKGDFSHF